jgi:hypothetical protein
MLWYLMIDLSKSGSSSDRAQPLSSPEYAAALRGAKVTLHHFLDGGMTAHYRTVCCCVRHLSSSRPCRGPEDDFRRMDGNDRGIARPHECGIIIAGSIDVTAQRAARSSRRAQVLACLL